MKVKSNPVSKTSYITVSYSSVSKPEPSLNCALFLNIQEQKGKHKARHRYISVPVH